MNKFETAILEIFFFLSMALGIMAILELAWNGIVSAYLDLNHILILWLLNGMIILFKPQKND